MRKQIFRKTVAIALAAAMVITGMPVRSDAAGTGTATADTKTVNVKGDVSATDDTTRISSPSGFDSRLFANAYEDAKLDISIKNAAVKVEGGDELSIEAVQDDLESGRIRLKGEFDFGDVRVGHIIVNALTERKKPAKLLVFLDDATSPFASVDIPKQRGKDNWTYIKCMSSYIGDKSITGKHTISLAFDYDADATKADKTKVLLREILFAADDIPTVAVDIDESEGTIGEMNGDSNHKTECYGSMSIKTPDGYVSEYGGDDPSGTYEMEYIRGRGNSTWGPDKRPYKIKLNKGADLFGMGSNKHWVMLANYFDFTMLRNKYTYWLGSRLGMEYTPQCVFVNFVMNGEYLGSYYLCEQVRIGKSRIAIDDLESTPDAADEPEITGGYLLSLGGSEDGKRTISTSRDVTMLIENPGFPEDGSQSEAQYEYISSYIQRLEDAIYGSGFKNSEGVSYKDYMDIESTAMYYLFQEFSMNGDGYGNGSTYLYKKRDGKLYWGPLWDFDYVAWGSTEYDGNVTEGFTQVNSIWFSRLFADKSFVKELKTQWAKLKPVLAESILTGGQIDKLARELYLSQKTNYAVTVSEATAESGVLPSAYLDEVERFKSWIGERITWFDAHINEIDSEAKVKTATFKNGKKTVAKVIVNYSYLDEDQIPEAPVKKGYRFKGWYQKIGKKWYKFSHGSVTGNVTFHARWSKINRIKGGARINVLLREFAVPAHQGYSGYIDYGTYPTDIDANKIKWTSSDPTILCADNNFYTLTGKKGVVKLTAKYKKNKVTLTIHVVDPAKLNYKVDFKLKKSKISIKKGQYKPLVLNTVPKWSDNSESDSNIRFLSTNEKVCEVDGHGVIHALKKGEATIIVQWYDSLQTCKVKVRK
ncbi:MAG: CotH kinase family protein [Eubacterium sp.]|nr:CotH kinase family protein [Eubacterium sp.]